jgi:adenylate cyclase
LRSLEDKNQIIRVFGQHVSPVVVNRILDQKKDLVSEIRYVCIMFLDIRGFTKFSESKKPEEVVYYLNSLFSFMIDIVNHNHGIINKFLGDGFMAVFGAPLSNGNDCQDAVTAALEIIERIEREIADGNIPPTRIGIGLHSGNAVTGTVGSILRQEYTVIGDVVNLACRIEQLNKQFTSQVLISEAVWDAVGRNIKNVSEIGKVQVKGRQTPVQIYQLV